MMVIMVMIFCTESFWTGDLKMNSCFRRHRRQRASRTFFKGVCLNRVVKVIPVRWGPGEQPCRSADRALSNVSVDTQRFVFGDSHLRSKKEIKKKTELEKQKKKKKKRKK